MAALGKTRSEPSSPNGTTNLFDSRSGTINYYKHLIDPEKECAVSMCVTDCAAKAKKYEEVTEKLMQDNAAFNAYISTRKLFEDQLVRYATTNCLTTAEKEQLSGKLLHQCGSKCCHVAQGVFLFFEQIAFIPLDETLSENTILETGRRLQNCYYKVKKDNNLQNWFELKRKFKLLVTQVSTMGVLFSVMPIFPRQNRNYLKRVKEIAVQAGLTSNSFAFFKIDYWKNKTESQLHFRVL